MEFLLTLRRRGIGDQAVLRAMDEVPREQFVEPEFAGSAYADQALPIACGQTISQPYVVAYMTEQLGCGRIIACSKSAPARATRPPCCRGWRARWSASSATARWPNRRAGGCARLGYDNVEVMVGDGMEGVPARAPFDRIIVTAAAETVPQSAGRSTGRRRHHGVAARPARRTAANRQAYQIAERRSTRENLIAVRFVPLLPGQAQEL